MIERRRGEPARVVVVGGGITGLCAAALMAQRGAQVRVLEALPEVGGVARAHRRRGLRFAPGPQYAWGWGAGGPAEAVVGALQLAVEMRQLPAAFEQVAFGVEPFSVVHENLPTQLATLPALERASALRFAEVLDAAGAAGARLGPEALFRHGGLRMMATLAHTPGASLRDRTWGITLRDMSVAALGRRYGVSQRALRMLTHAQGIFAEDLQDLSALLFASARHHLREPPFFPVGGFGALIDALCAAAQREGAVVQTGARVVGARRDGAMTTLTVSRGGATEQLNAAHVVWACSPGVLIRLLHDSDRPAQHHLARRLNARFAPSNPISALNLYVRLSPAQQRHLRDRNFTWFADDDDVLFSTPGATAGADPVRTLNFSAPTLHDRRTAGDAHVVCAFSRGAHSAEALRAALLRLLARLGVSPEVLEMEHMSEAVWTEQFGAFDGALYGRRLTTRSLRTSLCDQLPAGWRLAHSGAAIPGILGCLQLARAVAHEVTPAHALATRRAATPPRHAAIGEVSS